MQTIQNALLDYARNKESFPTFEVFKRNGSNLSRLPYCFQVFVP